MRRQTLFSGLDPAWAGQIRLDPKQLPARITATGGAARQQAAPVAIIDTTNVTLARSERGPFLAVPVASYRGVVLAASAATGAGAGIVLLHEQADYCIPLNLANANDELEADWRDWGKALGRPLFFAEADGALHAMETHLGSLSVARPRARRANSFFAARRPKFLTMRELGNPDRVCMLRTEAEIIARA